MGHARKCITGTQTFLISKLGGWKHTLTVTPLHSINSPRWTDTRHSNTIEWLTQYWCYGYWSVIGNRGGLWTFWNRGDIGPCPASCKTTKTNNPPKHLTKMGGQNISSSLKKKWTHTQWVGAPIMVQETYDCNNRNTVSSVTKLILVKLRIASLAWGAISTGGKN